MAESLKGRFIEEMKTRILSGELKPGDRLPPERELADESGISRGSVNQGILDLERMGFLRIVPRKGTFVSEYGKKATPETLAAIMTYDSPLFDKKIFSDFMDLRIIIERDSVRLAVERLDSEKEKMLRNALKCVNSSSSDNIADAVYCYHKCLTDISGNMAYAMVFQSFSYMIRNLISEHYKDKTEVELNLPKLALLTSAVIERDKEAADAIILSLLMRARNYLNEHLDR